MRNSGVSRRQVLRNALQAMVACGAASTIRPAHAALARPRPGVKIGMSTLGFGSHSNADLAKELAGAGFNLIQLFFTQTDSKYWRYNNRSDVSNLTAARCREIAAIYTDAGHTLHSLGVYANLIHPDDNELAANLANFDAMMEIGGHMGIRTFITESGHHRDAAAPAPAMPLEYQAAVWTRMVETVRKLASMADKHDAKVLLEPSFLSFFSTSSRVRRFVEEVGSPRIRVLLDPANILELDDLDEMFRQLAPLIDCVHAKDRKYHTDRGVPAGKGDVDYQRFVTLVAQQTPAAPMIFEYVGAKDYPDALAHLRGAMRAAGIREIN